MVCGELVLSLKDVSMHMLVVEQYSNGVQVYFHLMEYREYNGIGVGFGGWLCRGEGGCQ